VKDSSVGRHVKAQTRMEIPWIKAHVTPQSERAGRSSACMSCGITASQSGAHVLLSGGVSFTNVRLLFCDSYDYD